MFKTLGFICIITFSLEGFAHLGTTAFGADESRDQQVAKIPGYLNQCISALKGTQYEANAAKICGSVYSARTWGDCMTMVRQFSITNGQWFCNAVVNGHFAETQQDTLDTEIQYTEDSMDEVSL